MNKQIDDLADEIFGKIAKLRQLKEENNVKLGYSLCYGGILNAYREGDISYIEAIELFEKIK